MQPTPPPARPLTCPSARCESGATLLGIVDNEGRLSPFRTALVIDDDFVEKASSGRTPERRFRFASRCVEGACQQWTGSACGVIERVIAALGVEADDHTEEESLPPCPIRGSCRWFQQRQSSACRACSFVVTDTTC